MTELFSESLFDLQKIIDESSNDKGGPHFNKNSSFLKNLKKYLGNLKVTFTFG